MNKKEFGLKIKNLRKLHKLTQEQLSEKLDIDLRQIVRLEAGGSLPSLETFVNLCETLNVTPNEMLNFNRDNELKYDIYDLLSIVKPENLKLIKKLILATM